MGNPNFNQGCGVRVSKIDPKTAIFLGSGRQNSEYDQSKRSL